MSIPRHYLSPISASILRIQKSAFDSDEKRLLEAAVWAMADEFPDQAFGTIAPPGYRGDLLTFFCSAVRHWWASLRNGDSTPATVTHHAIHCPHDNAAIIALIMQFEATSGPLWTAQNTLDLKESA